MKKTFFALIFALSMLLISKHAMAVTKIMTREDLESIADQPAGDYILGADIDLSSAPWTPIPDFAGVFDGDGHTIFGMTMDTYWASNSSYIGYAGLFGQLKGGIISNLTLADAHIQISDSPGNLYITMIGTPEFLDYYYNNHQDPPQIYNCHVSGLLTVNVTDSNTKLNISALAYADNSTADVRIHSISNSTIHCNALWYCKSCTVSAEISGYADDGTVSMIMDSSDCSADGSININDNGESNNLGACGIVRSTDCSMSGSIQNIGETVLISKSSNSRFNGHLYSNHGGFLRECIECEVQCEATNLPYGEHADFYTIYDNNTYADTGNKTSGMISYTAGLSGEISIASSMNTSSLDSVDVNLDCGDSISKIAIINNSSQENTSSNNYENIPYHTGDVNITATIGNIIISRYLANIGNITCRNSTGSIGIVAGIYNTGNITATSSGGSIDVKGGYIYNSGDIEVHSYGGGVIICGIDGHNVDGGVNEGNINVQCENGYGTIYGVYKGTNSRNSGNIQMRTTNIPFTNTDYVYGIFQCEGGINTGDITCTCENSVIAYGAACAYGFNQGNIHVISTKGEANVTGANLENGWSTGNVYAQSDTSVEAAAAAMGTYGHATAIAGGEATAEGGTSSATSYMYDHLMSVSNGQVGWHLPKIQNGCSHPAFMITEFGTNPDKELGIQSCAGHYLKGYAWAHIVSGSTAEPAPLVDVQMPESDALKNGLAKVRMAFYETPSNLGTAISTLTYCNGSYKYYKENNTDFREIYLIVDVTNVGQGPGTWCFDALLPDGFSFDPETIVSASDPMVASLGRGQTKSFALPVYPLYSEEYQSSKIVRLNGDIITSATFPMYKSPNYIDCRPTGLINNEDSLPIRVYMDYSSVNDLATANTTGYNQRLAMLTCALSQAVYNQNGYETNGNLQYTSADYITPSMLNMGFSCVQWNQYNGTDGTACCIGQRKVTVNGEVRPVVMLVIRGTVQYEWIGNFLLGIESASAYHANFRSAADGVLSKLDDYCSIYGIDKKKTRIIITGHSRGAAVADIVAHDLNLKKDWKELVAYTYAAPNSTQNPVSDANILNIIYAYDVVGYVPYQGYGKYGRDYYIGMKNREAPDAVKAAFRTYMKGVDYENVGHYLGIEASVRASESTLSLISNQNIAYMLGNVILKHPGDSAIARAHSAENYLAWVFNAGLSYTMTRTDAIADSLDHNDFLAGIIALEKFSSIPKFIMISGIQYYCSGKESVFDSIRRHTNRRNVALALASTSASNQGGASLYEFHCPINLEILDASGNVIGKFENHVITQESNQIFMVDDDGNGDIVILPAGSGYKFRITGTADGTMDALAAQYTGGNEEPSISSCFSLEAVSIHAGGTMEICVDDSGYPIYNQGFDQNILSNCNAESGRKYYFGTIPTVGNPSYHWFYRLPSSSEFILSTNTNSYYTGVAEDYKNGMEVYCTITDGLGNVIRSNTAILNVSAASEETEYEDDYEIENGVLVKYNGIDDVPVIPPYVTQIGESAFQGNQHMTAMIMPEHILNIGQFAFSSCDKLTLIVLSESIQAIPTSMLSGCIALKNINLPNAVIAIGESAFFGCTALESCALPTNLQRMGTGAFKDCSSLVSAYLPYSLNYMGSGIYEGCTSLKNVQLPETLQKIQNNTFIGCSSLYFIQLPANLNVIGSKAFQNCTTLRSIFIPSSVTSIERAAFMGCSELVQVYCAGGDLQLSDMLFANCSALQKITLPETVSNIVSTTFRLVPTTCKMYTRDQTATETLRSMGYTVSLPVDPPSSAIVSGMKALKLPAGTEVIELEAFEGGNFQRVILPDGLKTIAPRAFQYCSRLIYINIPDSVESIAWDAFRGCSGVFFECSSGSVGESFAQSHGYTAVIN